MKDNITIIKKEYEELKGQFVIINNKVERLVNLGDDEEDYYYITFDGKNISWTSCVIKIIPLKGFIKNEDYDYIKNLAKLNDIDQVNKVDFVKYLNTYINKKSEKDKFLYEFCWDLN